jgi:hypothetical protein
MVKKKSKFVKRRLALAGLEGLTLGTLPLRKKTKKKKKGGHIKK